MARYKIEFYSKSLLRKFQINVVVPSLNLQGTLMNKNENYYQDRKDKKFPLMIFLAGFGEDENSWEINTPVDELCEKYEVAAVFVNGENKWYLNFGGVDNYYDLLEKDLIDFLYGNFANLSKEAPLIIAGVSMGGYGAIYHYLKNTDKYTACVAMSPATHPDHMDYSKFGTLEELFLENKGKDLHMDISIGTDDFIIKETREFDKYLIDNQIGVQYRYIDNYPHAWCLWRVEIVHVFELLKSKGYLG